MNIDPTYSKLRASVEAALKAKELEQFVKSRTLLHTYGCSTTPAIKVEIAKYLVVVDKKYELLLQKHVDSHIRLGRKYLQTICQWMSSGNGIDEFEDEFFNEETLNKIVLEYRQTEEETRESEDQTEDEQEETDNLPRLVSPRQAAREWKKCEQEVSFLDKPLFTPLESVRTFLAECLALRPSVLARLELEDVRRIIKTRGAGRRYARVRAALIRRDASIVLRHYQALREDAAQVRAEHPAHPATEIFAARADALVRTVEERRAALEAQCEAEKECRLSGIKEIMKEVREVHADEDKAWANTKDGADAVNQRHKELKEQQEKAKARKEEG